MISAKDRVKNFERYMTEDGKRGAANLYLNTGMLENIQAKLSDHYPELITMKLSKKVEYIHYLIVEYMKINGEFLLTQTGSLLFKDKINNNDNKKINNDLEIKVEPKIKSEPTQEEIDNYNATIAEIDGEYNEKYNPGIVDENLSSEHDSDDKPF